MIKGGGFYTKKIIQDMKVAMIKYKREIYFYMETPAGAILIRDYKLQPYKVWPILYAYASVFAIISFSFFLILRKLRPLILLRKKIERFAKGDMQVSFKTKLEDEIGLIANALEDAKNKINNILEARTLFLRNIMHELKTPITKGMITLEMLPESKQQERLKRVFLRLENLINEFASIEKITSGIKIEENFKTIRIVDIIDEAIDIAMINQNSIEIINEDEDVTIEGDFKLFSIAIKNLIDNAIKYSHDSKAVIKFNKQRIIIANRGEKLKQSLEYYVKPFTQEESATSGFGLGLYIVVTILEAHKKELLYKHKNNTNYFTIKLTEVS